MRSITLILSITIFSLGAGAKSVAQRWSVVPLPDTKAEESVIEKILSPTLAENLAVTKDSAAAVAQVGDSALQFWLNSPEVKSSTLGRTANSVQQSMKAEIVFPSARDEVEHRLGFHFLALQSLALFQYKGWLQAQAKYNVLSSEANYEISEKILNDKDLFLSHRTSTQNQVSSVGVRWSW